MMNHRYVAILSFVFLLRFSGAFAEDNLIQNPFLQKAEKFFLKSEFDSSLKYLNLANVYFINKRQDSLTSVVANRKAQIYLLQEQKDSAIAILKSNRNIIENRFGDQNELMAMCNDLFGDYYMSILDADAALKYYKQSLFIRKNIYDYSHPRIAFSYSNISKYYSFKIERDSAFYIAQKAYKFFMKNPELSNNIPYERIFTAYAYAYKIFHLHKGPNQSRTLQETRGLYSKALDFIEQKYGINSFASASVYRNIGNTYTDILLGFQGSANLKSNYFKLANYYYDKSILICTTYLKGNNSSLSTMHYVKGLLYDYSYAEDSSEKCLLMYDNAIHALIPSYRLNNMLSEFEMKSCSSKYELMTTIFTKSYYYLKLYNITGYKEHLKSGFALAKHLVPLWNYVIEEFESPYANRIITIYNGKVFNFLVELAWSLYELERDSRYLHDIFYFSEQSKGSLQKRLLLDVVPDVNDIKSSILITPSDIQQALPNPETVFIEFFDTTMVIGLSKGHFVVKKINEQINQDSLLKVYQRMLYNNNPEIYQSTTHLIFETFFEPVLRDLGNNIRHLIIANDGMISKVAVSGLVSDTMGNDNDFRQLKYVAHKYSIRHVLSGNDLIRNIQRNYNESETLIGFAPNFKMKSSLPFSKSLVQNLQEQIWGDYYLDKEGSKEIFLIHAPKYRVIQLSTHAEADLEETMKSKIYFSDVDEQSNYITLDSIYKLKFQTQLAVLSACETNVGRLEYGEGSMNFSRAFLYAGCKSTLTSQWQVDDKTTSSILLNFYNHALDNNTLSESLQKAQLAYLNICNSSAEANPFFWSSLVITGSDDSILLSKKLNYSTYFIVAGFTLVFLRGLCRLKKKREQAPNS